MPNLQFIDGADILRVPGTSRSGNYHIDLTIEDMMRAISGMPERSWLRKFTLGPLQNPSDEHWLRLYTPVVQDFHWCRCHVQNAVPTGAPTGAPSGNFCSVSGRMLAIEVTLAWDLDANHYETTAFVTLGTWDVIDFVEQFSNKALDQLAAVCVDVPEGNKMLKYQADYYWDAAQCDLSSYSGAS